MPLATGPQKEVIERLSAVDIFAPLSTEETAKLAGGAVRHVFAPGETRHPRRRPGLVNVRGSQRSRAGADTDGGKHEAVAVLSEGAFFGEMALFTGEPRTANVVALEETEVLEIGHAAMKHLFETNPDLAESISWTIAERQGRPGGQFSTGRRRRSKPNPPACSLRSSAFSAFGRTHSLDRHRTFAGQKTGAISAARRRLDS